MMKQQISQLYNISCLLILIVFLTVNQNPSVLADQPFESPCGDATQVSDRIGRCLDPIFEVIEGKVEKPTSDADLVKLCERFTNLEKCIRGTARDCLQGIHKTAVSSVASSSRRFRAQECKTESSRAKYFEVANCSMKVSRTVVPIFHNHTAIVQGIRDSKLRPEQKLSKTCCIFGELDKQLSHIYDGECPKSRESLLKIMHALTDDARSTVCVNPKCQNALTPFLKTKYKPSQILIEPLMEVLFHLNDQ